MSVICRCDRIGCRGFNPDEADRCSACPWPLRVRLIAYLRRLAS